MVQFPLIALGILVVGLGFLFFLKWPKFPIIFLFVKNKREARIVQRYVIKAYSLGIIFLGLLALYFGILLP